MKKIIYQHNTVRILFIFSEEKKKNFLERKKILLFFSPFYHISIILLMRMKFNINFRAKKKYLIHYLIQKK